MTVIAPEFTKAANMLNALKMVGKAEASHPLMASLYAPLAIGDFMEGKRQRREGGRGAIPMLGGLALSAMAAPHVADPVVHYMQRNKLDGAGALAKHLLSKLAPSRDTARTGTGTGDQI